MIKNFSFIDYFFKLKETVVADKLLGILHIIAQAGAALGMLSSGLAAFAYSPLYGIGILLLMIILFPIASVFIRFWFELISVLFSINTNIQEIKGVFTDTPEECCEGEGECCSGCASEKAESEEGAEAPAKKETKKSAPKKAPTKKTTKK
ncbi:MAG: DUF4282 domain-containing protein [Candidatus Absconditabacteria bacterium]|nr:DUF4282 domain-containing protein [Candidatus Absconditabacteria bacterium]MDD3867999.1 DUF4282 domain-containing protein [Candidatus Absconditabacteria bacterium]MDD4714246.1 DUF4282 domain-containing protein [Candidatus Absconditabacteria bacterium]